MIKMGSFVWDNHCYLQYHNGRPLSVALTEPCNCQEKIPSHFPSDFGFQPIQPLPRSHSLGRRHKREYFKVYHPTVHHTSSFCSSPFSLYRPIDHNYGRDVLVEKFETVSIEEEQCRPRYAGVSFVRAPSPPIRQIKVRSRPSSCHKLHHREAADNQWTKVVEERHDENYEYHYDYTLPATSVVKIQREPTPPRFIRHDERSTIEDIRIPITPRPERPATRDVGTTTPNLPRRPLSISETQVIDRYEKNERVRRDSFSDDSSYTTSTRPLQRHSDDNDFDDRQNHRVSTKTHRKEFVQRMQARNGTISIRPSNALSVHSGYRRDQKIVRPTNRPREALVDTFGIVSAPGELSEPSTPITIERSSRSRSYFQPT